jgi:uncharacterized protein (TIGR03437 family)
MIVSLLGAQAFGQSLSWDTSGNSMLSGTYYFRDVLYNITSSGINQYAVFGNITFSGTGTYSIAAATGLEVGGAPGPVGPLTGTYSINSAGFGFMSDPLLPLVGGSGSIRGMVSHGVFMGTSTDPGYSNLFVAALEPSPAPTAATFSGTYAMTYFNFSALDGYPYDAQFTLSSSGGGTFSTSNLQGLYGTATGPATVTQSVGSEKYTASSGAVVLNFPTLSNNTPLLSGQEYLYFSSDGNLVFGGSPTQADFFIGVNTSASAGSPLLNSPLFYNAGTYAYIDSSGFGDFDNYYGSFSLSSGNVIQHLRTFSLANGSPVDSITTDTAPTTSGATYSDGLYDYTIGGGGLYRIGYGLGPLLGIDLAVAAPSFSGSGVYVNPTGVVNAASYAPFTTGVAPGELLVITGTGLAPNTSIGAGDIATTAQWPIVLNGVKVFIDGVQAPLYYVSATQIAALVPFEANQFALATIQVNNNGVLSKTITEFVTPGVAGIFTNPADGIGYAAAEHLNGSVVTEANPAQPGEYISVFLTGLGTVFPPNADGAPGSSTSLNNTVDTITANIDSFTGTVTAASVVYAGLAPGYAGLYQVNVQIPTGATAGDNFLEIDVTSSTTGVAVSTVEEALIPIGSGTATSSAVPRKEANGEGQKAGKHYQPRPSQKHILIQPVQP